MVISGYKPQDLHTKRVLVELQLRGGCVIVEGIADYGRGELHIPIKDPAGDFVVILHDATWDGEITDAPDGNGFLIRLHS
jgi:hypothetical protein